MSPHTLMISVIVLAAATTSAQDTTQQRGNLAIQGQIKDLTGSRLQESPFVQERLKCVLLERG